MSCHRAPDRDDPKSPERLRRLCFHCHGQGEGPAQRLTAGRVAAIHQEEYASSSHRDMDCLECHFQAADWEHDRQRRLNCSRCHFPHDERVAHDAHLGVSCEACHLRDIVPFKDSISGRILWKRIQEKGGSSTSHHMVSGCDEERCGVCHHPGNDLGAAAVALPAKSLLCMPCHGATLSVGDPTTIVGLLLFLLGTVLLFSEVIGGRPSAERSPGKPFHTTLAPGLLRVINTVVLDVFFQRRLYRQSRKRWLIHGLLFWPLVVRCSWGLLALGGSLLKPEWSFIWAMIDRNHPLTAFVFDLSGFMMIFGLVLLYARKKQREWPDHAALWLMGGTLMLGFVLEAVRITLSGIPGGAAYGFIGFALSRLFSPSASLSVVYGYLWYFHAGLTAAFVACLPFTRMMHMILSPLVLALNASETEN